MSPAHDSRGVVVVIGAGGMGEAVARQVGPGRTVMLASRTEGRLHAAAARLRDEGNVVHERIVDIASRESVSELVDAAGALGPLDTIIQTGGLSPAMADPMEILRVDLVGTAIVLDEFIRIARPGTVAICVASMAGCLANLSTAFELALATSPTDQLLDIPEVVESQVNAVFAYMVAKRGNQLRVQNAANAWGIKGARVVSVSPGVTATPMAQEEFAGAFGEQTRQLIENSCMRRIGTPTDISAAIAFLISPAASYITGTDLLIDGGVVASIRSASLAQISE
jgi:NAD(P)-dependent dehydrogenase (short-subunit alcohol dehydrogenase family)